jgi:3-oxoacyl-[acyl-carrier protein] reductase
VVLGGSGYVGSAVVRNLRARGLHVWHTYLRHGAKGRTLAAETGTAAVELDLSRVEDIRQVLSEVGTAAPIDVLVHAAGAFAPEEILDVTAEVYERAMSVAVRAPLFAVQWLAQHVSKERRVDVVVVGALDRAQSLPLPACFAAAEGAKGAMVMALAKELGRKNVRVNAVSVGLLEGGASTALSDAMAKDFAAFSALGRRGTAEEVARVVEFLALDSDFLTGKTIPVNGGL